MSSLIFFAGLPAQTSFGGTDFVTTEEAPIIEFSPMVMPFNIVVWAPIKTLSSITIGLVTTLA
jgi:hypothetical protein